MKYNQADQEFLLSLGQRIRLLRMSKGLSQEQLALESNLDRTYVSEVERGRRNISALNLNKLSHALNVSLSELLKGVTGN